MSQNHIFCSSEDLFQRMSRNKPLPVESSRTMYMSVYMLVVFSEYFKFTKPTSKPVHELYYSQQQSSVKCNSKQAAMMFKE
ncbi:hypothetical protein Nmel_008335 [Mimus melanotis]